MTLEIRNLIKNKRLEKKLTQQQLAKKLFVGRTTVTMMETNTKYTPSPHLAKLVGKELDLDWTIFYE